MSGRSLALRLARGSSTPSDLRKRSLGWLLCSIWSALSSRVGRGSLVSLGVGSADSGHAGRATGLVEFSGREEARCRRFVLGGGRFEIAPSLSWMICIGTGGLAARWAPGTPARGEPIGYAIRTADSKLAAEDARCPPRRPARGVDALTFAARSRATRARAVLASPTARGSRIGKRTLRSAWRIDQVC